MRHLLTLTLPLLLWANIAQAGDFIVRDELGVLSPAQVDSLRAAARGWPFDLHMIIRNSNPESLLPDAIAWVDAPKVIVVAISPQFRKIHTRFGSGTGIPKSQFDPIADAGKPLFRQQQWALGVQAIGDKAKTQTREVMVAEQAPPPRRTQTTTTTEQTQTTTAHTTQPASRPNVVITQSEGSSSAWVWWVLGLMVLTGLIIWFVVWMNRRERRQLEAYQRLQDEMTLNRNGVPPDQPTTRRQYRATARPAPTRAPTPTPTPAPVPVYTAPPAPAPVYVPQPVPMYVPPTYTTPLHNPSSDLALGMMINESMHHHHHERERVIERPVYVERPSHSTRSYDMGGSNEVVTTKKTTTTTTKTDDSPSISFDSGGNSDTSYDSGSGNSNDSF